MASQKIDSLEQLYYGDDENHAKKIAKISGGVLYTQLYAGYCFKGTEKEAKKDYTSNGRWYVVKG